MSTHNITQTDLDELRINDRQPRAERLKATVSKGQAREIIANGGEVFAVYGRGVLRLYRYAHAARAYADKIGVDTVLDWETGEYADA